MSTSEALSRWLGVAERQQGPANLGRLELLVQLLIILSLLAFAIETLPNLSTAQREALDLFETFTIGVFTVEYMMRLALSRPRRSYVLSFYGIMDLVAILPFYLSGGLDLRSVRAFRLLRLFRIFKLARYSAAIRRFHRAFLIVKEELALFGVAAGIVLYLSAVGIYYFEHEVQPEKFGSFFHSLWWAVATLTTVGYGDVYPVTLGGRFFTFVVLVVGLGVVAVPTGLVASALGKAREDLASESRRSSETRDSDRD
ncbi:MAG: ion transporter [Betaproteobacteria bacterium]|nr:ion transporter [Betaproteobacteria bacterium]